MRTCGKQLGLVTVSSLMFFSMLEFPRRFFFVMKRFELLSSKWPVTHDKIVYASAHKVWCSIDYRDSCGFLYLRAKICDIVEQRSSNYHNIGAINDRLTWPRDPWKQWYAIGKPRHTLSCSTTHLDSFFAKFSDLSINTSILCFRSIEACFIESIIVLYPESPDKQTNCFIWDSVHSYFTQTVLFKAIMTSPELRKKTCDTKIKIYNFNGLSGVIMC